MLDVYSINKSEPVLWKNGLGKTRLLFSGYTRQSDSVRVSLAYFNKSVEFSRFPGIRRISILLTTSDIKLDFLDGESVQLKYLRPYQYQGDRALYGNVKSGEPNILNIMSASDAVSAQVIGIDGCYKIGPGKYICITLNEIEITCDGRCKAVSAGNVLSVESNTDIQIRSTEGSKKSRMIVVTL
ncbi:HutD family protein [Leeia oryzae]|uniref:HutD family protein n=1 Tax=Leeia oryzae TaxID=356662 RepID=UPI0003671434|nr:HutD family protein [Leeia oryzae]